MSNRRIEDLLRPRIKNEELTPFEKEKQRNAVFELVRLAHQQLVEHQIDFDVAHEDVPVKYHLFESFFSHPKIKDFVVRLSTNGLPNVSDGHNLSIDIYCKSSKGTRKLVEINAPKLPDDVNDQDALKLSIYRPGQLLEIAEIIRDATPIEKNEFYSFFPPKGHIPVKNIILK